MPHTSLSKRTLCSLYHPGQPVPESVPIDQKYLGHESKTFIKIAEEACPFIKDTITAKVTHLEPGKMTMELPFKDIFIGNPVTKVLHGGVTASLIDHVGGFAAMSSISEKDYLLSTVDLRIDYITPAPASTIICEARVISNKKTLIRTDVIAYNADRTKTIAIGRGLYSKYSSNITFQDTMEL